jgi:hypothetical protein
MEWLNTETISKILQASGVTGLLAFSLFGLIKVFSTAFAKKDEKFAEVLANNNNQFMQFIERERIQHNVITQETIRTLTLIQQELSKNTDIMRKQVELMDRLSENINKLEHRTEMYYAEIKSEQAELMLTISKMMQKLFNNN